jgi:hypothetical protein
MGVPLLDRQVLERRIVRALIAEMRAAFPDEKMRVWDGGELVKCATPGEAEDAIFAVDESTLRLGKHWVFLVQGNGDCIISDYGADDATDEAINRAMRACGLEV